MHAAWNYSFSLSSATVLSCAGSSQTPQYLSLLRSRQDGCWLSSKSRWHPIDCFLLGEWTNNSCYCALHSVAFAPLTFRPSSSHTQQYVFLCKCDRVKVLHVFFFSQFDLVSTIGESVALGAAGIIMWGDTAYAGSKVSINTIIIKTWITQTQLSDLTMNVMIWLVLTCCSCLSCVQSFDNQQLFLRAQNDCVTWVTRTASDSGEVFESVAFFIFRLILFNSD